MMHDKKVFRLLWAEALDDGTDRTAIVIQLGSEMFGGIATLHSFDWRIDYGQYWYGSNNMLTAKLNFIFEWYQVVNSAEEFRQTKRWRKHLESSNEVKQIEGPRKALEYKPEEETNESS